MNRFTLLILLPVFLVMTGSYCETDILQDPAFQFWCGEQPCEWDVEDGEVRQVPTWHEHDYAIELVGAPVVISQLAKRGSSSCVRIELIADVEPRAMLLVQIDFDDDGSADWSSPINRQGFQSMSWEIQPRSSVGSWRFILNKAAEGRAVITQLRASSECERP
ncbi:MAG: hypothetical protein HKN10_18710 [Myxococcales bacterium]|nr:hypothetical protein [Myxococcales bacterium]